MVTIRAMDTGSQADVAGVRAIDTAFQTASVYDVVVGARRIELVERALATPLTKRYPIEDAFAHWAQWEDGFVAEDDEDDAGIVGFAATEYEPWHARLVLWHLYVAPARRRGGVGRALLAHVEAHGRATGARHVWLETSNVNVPGIAAYARLGYALCGVDTLYYDATGIAAETAVYLAKRL